MKKVLFLILLLFIQIDVFANEDLLELAVNGESVECSGYECQIEIDAKEAKITYKLGESVKEASPSSGHTVTFDNAHSVKIEVSYNDGSVANYTLTITKHVKSADNSLKELIINDETIELKEEVFVYSYETKFDDELVKVKGSPNDLNASCQDMEYEFSLDKSSLSIEYPVKAENGEVRNYTIILKRKNKPDTTLKSLTLSEIDLTFDPNQLDYEITIPYSINTTEVKAVPNNSKATVSVKMDEILVVGENLITVIVTNDGVSDTYSLRINRLENFDETLANLETLEIEGYKLDFDANILEYTLVYKEIPKQLKINAVAVAEEGKLSIENNENLEDGSIVLIKVELENGLIRTYKLHISQQVEKVIEEEPINKITVIVLIVVLIIVMVVLLILQLKEKKTKKKRQKHSKIKAKQEEEIEVI